MTDEPLQPSQEARSCAGEIAQMLFDPNPHPQQLEGWAGLLKGAHDDSAIVQALARFEQAIRADQDAKSRADQRERDAKVAETYRGIANPLVSAKIATLIRKEAP